jgi:hypothetical protein
MPGKTSREGRPEEPRPGVGGATCKLIARALDLVEKRTSWTRRHLARDKQSHPVSPTSPRAVRFCVGGALWRAAAETFDFGIVIGPPQHDPEPAVPIPLELAYRRVGLALVEPLGARAAITIREEDRDGDVLLPTLVLTTESGVRIEISTTWFMATHVLNDYPGVRHPDVLEALHTAKTAFDASRTIGGGATE